MEPRQPSSRSLRAGADRRRAAGNPGAVRARTLAVAVRRHPPVSGRRCASPSLSAAARRRGFPGSARSAYRSEERRVGNVFVSTCTFLWSPFLLHNKYFFSLLLLFFFFFFFYFFFFFLFFFLF